MWWEGVGEAFFGSGEGGEKTEWRERPVLFKWWVTTHHREQKWVISP